MAKSSAYITGLILSIMVTFNGLLSGFTNAYASNVVYHGIGLIFFGILLLVIRKKLPDYKFQLKYLIPGFLGSLTIILNNVVLTAIGVTMMITFTLVGQVITSIVIDHHGLFGKPISKRSPKQWLGVLVMVSGLLIMVI